MQRILWFTVLTVLISYAAYLIVGGIVNAQTSGADATVVIRDELGPNSHQLSGMVMVPSSCDQLSVDTKTLSPTSFELVFSTWQEPSVHCSADETPRFFEKTLFAPAAGITFSATLDGEGLPIAVIPAIAGR